jgi:GntR family transcriptional repressor for pyruvate dehydrogenase complex
MSVEQNVDLERSAHKRYQEIVSSITAAIRDGKYAPGARLPGERELAKEFGVGRSAIREAMVALEVHGLVEARQGTGVFIVPSPRCIGAPTTSFSAIEIITARRLCEGEAAALAAATITDVDLAKLAKRVRDLQTRSIGAAADVAAEGFHLTLAQSTDNSAIVHVVTKLLHMQRMSNSCRALIERARSARVQTWHHAYLQVFRAVRAGDSAAARSALHEHFDHVLAAGRHSQSNAEFDARSAAIRARQLG